MGLAVWIIDDTCLIDIYIHEVDPQSQPEASVRPHIKISQKHK